MSSDQPWQPRRLGTHERWILQMIHAGFSVSVSRQVSRRSLRRLLEERLLGWEKGRNLLDRTLPYLVVTERGEECLKAREAWGQKAAAQQKPLGSRKKHLRSLTGTEVLIGLDWVEEHQEGFSRHHKPLRHEPVGFVRKATALEAALVEHLASVSVQVPQHKIPRRAWRSRHQQWIWREQRCFSWDGLQELLRFLGVDPRRHTRKARQEWKRQP